MNALFTTLTSKRIAAFILGAKESVCYAAPGIQFKAAQALVEVAQRLGPEMLSVSLDVDEPVFRMGFGSFEAVSALRRAGILISHSPGLRIGLVVVDGSGFTFAPTALYLEAEPAEETIPNAMELSADQLHEAVARLSPVAKAIAIAHARNELERTQITCLPVEIGVERLTEARFARVDRNLKEAPPVRFDLARQVRVYSAYLQYVELKLTGAAIQRHRLTIPPSILKLGGSKDLEGRLRTTFDLIEKGGNLSSKKLEDELNEIRKNFTPSLGKDHGRVVLKAQKANFEKRLEAFKAKLAAHQKEVAEQLQYHLDKSRKQIIDYYLPRVAESPPDAMLGQLLHGRPTNEDARRWLAAELDRVFPKADSLTQRMQLEMHYKDVTFETLNQEDFLEAVKTAFPMVDWDKAHEEFMAAGESEVTRTQL